MYAKKRLFKLLTGKNYRKYVVIATYLMKKVLVSYFLFFLLVYEAQSRKKGEASS